MPDPVKQYNTILPIPNRDRYQRRRPQTRMGLFPVFAAIARVLRGLDDRMAREHPIDRTIENIPMQRRYALHPAFAGSQIELTDAEPSSMPPVIRNLFDELNAVDSTFSLPAVTATSTFRFRPPPTLIFDRSRLHAFLTEDSLSEPSSNEPSSNEPSLVDETHSDSESEEEIVTLTNKRERVSDDELNPSIKRSRRHRSPSSSPTF